MEDMIELEKSLTALAQQETGDEFMVKVLRARNPNPSTGVIKAVTEGEPKTIAKVYNDFKLLGDQRSCRLIALAVQYSKWATGIKAKFILDITF